MTQTLRLPVLYFICAFSLIFASPINAAAEKPLKVVAFGDSLTAGYNLPSKHAFPAILEAALKERGHNLSITNAGVSGDTTTSGLARLDWSIPAGTDAVILELGANDMLRGVDPAVTAKALDTIIARLKQRDIAVLLAGMRSAPNMGADYTARFEKIYADLGLKYNLIVYPFFLEGVAGNAHLLLADGVHPNAEGVRKLVEHILPTAEQFISELPGR